MSLSFPWIKSARFDSTLILLPALLAVGVALFWGDVFNEGPLPLWMWLVLVMGVDVAHVYSTLYKTYLHPEESLRHKNLLIIIPLACWIVGVFLYNVGAPAFWSVLAYLAVYHFVRQQYGLLRLYTRTDDRLDAVMIYSATVYPLIYWHAHPREFQWFIEGDFFFRVPVLVEKVALVLYGGVVLTYLVREFRHRPFNVPKNILVLGTALSWYVGIVLLNGDFTFTVTNVLAHGIPYLGLIWAWGEKNPLPLFKRRFAFLLFIGLLLGLAWIEEGLWAGLIWREHLDAFAFFSKLPVLEDKATLSWLVPLLALPQATHYVLDGFIWRMRKQNTAGI